MEQVIKIPSELLEEMLITFSLKNASFFLKIKPYLSTNSYKSKSYFNDVKNQMIFNLLSKWYDKYTSFPTLKEIKLFLDRIPEEKDIRVLLSSMVDRYYSEDVSSYNEQNLVEEAKNYIIEQRVIEAIALSQVDMDKGSYANIVEKMRDAVSVNFDKDLGVSIKDYQNVVETINSSLKGKNTVELGIPSLDRAINILAGGEIFTVAGTPGIGKSIFLGNFAINAFLQNKKVLVYSMETGKARLLTRYIVNLLNTNKTEILSDTEGIAKRLQDEFKENKGDIILKEYGANQASCNDLMAHINDLIMYKQWKPDVIVVDYILIMLTNDKRLSSENPFKYYKTVTEELRNIAKFYNVPVLTACQINREGQADGGGSKALVTAKNVSESRGIYDTTDYFATINQTTSEKKKNELRIYLEKNRNDQSGIIINCSIDYPHMRVTERTS